MARATPVPGAGRTREARRDFPTAASMGVRLPCRGAGRKREARSAAGLDDGDGFTGVDGTELGDVVECLCPDVARAGKADLALGA